MFGWGSFLGVVATTLIYRGGEIKDDHDFLPFGLRPGVKFCLGVKF